MNVSMFSLAVGSLEESIQMRSALVQLHGIIDFIERREGQELVIIFDSEQVDIGQIMATAKPLPALVSLSGTPAHRRNSPHVVDSNPTSGYNLAN